VEEQAKTPIRTIGGHEAQQNFARDSLVERFRKMRAWRSKQAGGQKANTKLAHKGALATHHRIMLTGQARIPAQGDSGAGKRRSGRGWVGKDAREKGGVSETRIKLCNGDRNGEMAETRMDAKRCVTANQPGLVRIT